MMSKLDDTFNFKSERFNQVRSKLDEDFKANRAQVAGLLLSHVDELSILASKTEVTRTDFKALMDSIQRTRGSLINLFKKSFEIVIQNLTAEEIQNLDKFSLKKLKEDDKKIALKDDYLEKQLDSFEKVMDFLFDSTNKSQREIYNQFLTDNYAFFEAQSESRKAFVKKFDSLTSKKEQLLTFVMKYYEGDDSIKDLTEVRNKETFSNNFNEVLFKVWTASSSKQRNYLKNSLMDLKEDLKKMVAD